MVLAVEDVPHVAPHVHVFAVVVLIVTELPEADEIGISTCVAAVAPMPVQSPKATAVPDEPSDVMRTVAVAYHIRLVTAEPVAVAAVAQRAVPAAPP